MYIKKLLHLLEQDDLLGVYKASLFLDQMGWVVCKKCRQTDRQTDLRVQDFRERCEAAEVILQLVLRRGGIGERR